MFLMTYERVREGREATHHTRMLRQRMLIRDINRSEEPEQKAVQVVALRADVRLRQSGKMLV